DRQQRADQGADHRMAEGVGDNPGDSESTLIPLPGELPQRAYGRGTLAPAAERGEVVLTQQRTGGGVHRVEAQWPRVEQDLVSTQRVGVRRVVADPVRIAPPDRGEASVEAGRG